ncbi:MAG: Fe-S cluster assembly protein SufD [Verrucomicrobiaceae bacterium]|nr:Fe-S cluster assembly protein SufD [Verrucomicrobiaceae bacterium]
MSASETILDQYTALIAARLQTQRDPLWLRQLRETSLQQLQLNGLPSKRWESWHYSPADFWLTEFGTQHALAPITPDENAPHADLDVPSGHAIYFNHGYLVDQQLQNDEREKFSLQPLSALSEQQHSALIDWLRTVHHADPLAHLVTALTPETWVLTVEPRARLKHPIVISQRSSQPGNQISQLIVWAGENSEATIVEHFSAAPATAAYLHCSHTALKLERNSKLIYARINRDGAQAQHLGVVESSVGRDARLQLQVLESASEAQLKNRIRNGIYVRLDAPNAEFIARGAFAASEQQHIDYHFTVDHLSDHGRCDILMQGLAADQSRGVVNGRIHIAANTHHNDGHFTTHNLLLSDEAEIDAKPELEIYADEVSCAHGATIGQLDEEQLLYLRTRGINRDDAIALLTEGFLKAGLLDSGNPALNDFFAQQLLAALPKPGV